MRRGSARRLSVATACLLFLLAPAGGLAGQTEPCCAQGDEAVPNPGPAASAKDDGPARPPVEPATPGSPAEAAKQPSAKPADSDAPPASPRQPIADKPAADPAPTGSPAPTPKTATDAAAASAKDAQPAAASGATPSSAAQTHTETKAGDAASDAAAAIAGAEARLKALGPPDEKNDSAQTKALREAFEERKRLINELEKELKDRTEIEHPAKSPERELSRLKAELERTTATLEQARSAPESLLPSVARGKSARVSPAAMNEIREAIEAAKNELSEASASLDSLRSDPAHKIGAHLASLRAERDKIQQRCASLAAVRSEREAALTAATTAEARELARQHLANFEWESRLESARLVTQEARIALEVKLSTLEEPHVQLVQAKRELARRTLMALEGRHRELVERQQGDLAKKAEEETRRADGANDPLERYRARRNAELLQLRAQVLQDEHAAAAGPNLALEVQREQADRVVRDFADLRQLVEEGRAPAIIALRLRNDYQHLSIERADIARNELVNASSEMKRIENSLTSVEFDLINHSRDVRIAIDELLEELPKERWAQAKTVAYTLAAERLTLLTQRRMTLEKQAERAQAVHKQVVRRLNTLEDQYNYVRTHIFWMRDTEPIGLSSVAQLPREGQRLARSTLRLAADAADRGQWGRFSPAFALALLTVLALPWPLYRMRGALLDWLEPTRHAVRLPQDPPPE